MKLLSYLMMLILLPFSVFAQQPFCAKNLGEFPVHETNKPFFNTPITTGPDGAVYVAYIDPALRTVITRYEPTTNTWSSPTVLAQNTHADMYHTQPSLGIDIDGYIHAVYNMHNTPWQYSVSKRPHDVTEMVFKGQYAGTNPGGGTTSAANCTGTCRDNWIKNEPGISTIPGNQITYPVFTNTIDGSLFLAFRQCLNCAESFFNRQWSLGLVRYNTITKKWDRVADVRPWATEPGKVALGAKIAGDAFNNIHVAWLWCNRYNQTEGGSACFAYPNFISYAKSHNKGTTWHNTIESNLILPLTSRNSEVVVGPKWFDDVNAIGYFSGGTRLSIDNKGLPTIMVFPNTTDSEKGIKRSYVTLSQGEWTEPKFIDYAPSFVYRDTSGKWIAISSGMRIHISTDNRQTWKIYPLDLARGAFNYAHDQLWRLRSGQLRLYAQSKDNRLIIWSLTFLESGSCS